MTRYNRLTHMQGFMSQRNRYEADPANRDRRAIVQTRPFVSSFSRSGDRESTAVDSLQKEVDQIQTKASQVAKAVVARDCIIVPYDGTEDPKAIEASRPNHQATSEERAALPA